VTSSIPCRGLPVDSDGLLVDSDAGVALFFPEDVPRA
jgi:hypothetical protein